MASEEPADATEAMQYHGYLVGRPTKTAEVGAPDGTSTVEAGTLTFELAPKDDIMDARQEGGWTVHYVGPDGGVGFGLDEGNNGGVIVPYDLVDVIPFPRPMPESEAREWWDEDRMLEWAENHAEISADEMGADDAD